MNDFKQPERWIPKNPELLEVYVKAAIAAYEMGLKPLTELQEDVKEWPREERPRPRRIIR